MKDLGEVASKFSTALSRPCLSRGYSRQALCFKTRVLRQGETSTVLLPSAIAILGRRSHLRRLTPRLSARLDGCVCSMKNLVMIKLLNILIFFLFHFDLVGLLWVFSSLLSFFHCLPFF